MTYGDLGDMLEGISLSLSGDVMLGFGDETSQMSIMDFLKKTVLKIRENEAREKGITLEDQFNLPPETLLHPESKKMLEDALNKLDEQMKS